MANEAVLRAAHRIRTIAASYAEESWHSWFAWRPIQTLDDQKVWLRWVEWAYVATEFDGNPLRVYVYRLA